MGGIEQPLPHYECGVLPLNYTSVVWTPLQLSTPNWGGCYLKGVQNFWTLTMSNSLTTPRTSGVCRGQI